MDQADQATGSSVQTDCRKFKRGLWGRRVVKACSSKSSSRNYIRKCRSTSGQPTSSHAEFHELVKTESDTSRTIMKKVFKPASTRSIRLSEKKCQQTSGKTTSSESSDLNSNSEIDLYSLYSSGCVTRGQMTRAKKMFWECSATTTLDSLNKKKQSGKKISEISKQHREECPDAMEIFPLHLPSTSTDVASKPTIPKTSKIMMKRKHETLNETAKSPEKKACKSSLGSVIATSTAVLPTAAVLQQKRPATRRCTSSRKLRSFSGEEEINYTISPSSAEESGALTAPPTPTKSTSSPNGSDDWLRRFLCWNASEKINVLDRLIGVCQSHEVRHMLEMIEPQFQRDFISLLPKELALYVLSFLEPRDLLVAAQTCKYWRILTEDNLMWKEKCIEEGIVDRHSVKNYKNAPKSKKSLHMSIGSSWKAAFLRQVRIEANWRLGNEKPTKILKGHDDHVITCLQFNGSRIVSGSDDNTLKVWSAVSGKCLRTLTGHTGGVWASQMQNNLIVSGSTDRALKVWNADSGECVHTLYGHTSTVRCLALHENTVVSGSRDATLRVWNINTGVCQHVLVGHMAAVRCVCYDGKKVVSGAYDYMVKVWDPVTEECLHTLQGHSNRVYSLQFDSKYVVSGSLDTSIRVWDIETGRCLHTLMGHQSLTSGMELKDNILVSGNADSTVKIWDIKTGECLKTLEGPNKHLSAVTCLQFHGKFVITSSDDGTVKLWDIKTGKVFTEKVASFRRFNVWGRWSDVIRDLVTLESRGSGGVVWRIRASPTKLVCAVGSRNGTEETKLQVIDFDTDII